MTNNDLTPSNYNATLGHAIPLDEFEDDSFDADYGWLDEYADSAVEQGMYDDDPNPYHGDYSEW